MLDCNSVGNEATSKWMFCLMIFFQLQWAIIYYRNVLVPELRLNEDIMRLKI